MATIVDRAYLELDGEQIDCKSITVRTSGNKNKVNTMNRKNRAVGYTRGIPEFSIDADFPYDADLATNFDNLALSKTQFTTVVEYEDGDTFSYLDCQVDEVERSAGEGGDVGIKLTISALDYVKS